MNILQKIFGKKQTRSDEPTAFAELIAQIQGGTYITREKAMQIPAVSAAVDFISNTVASLPIRLYKCDDKFLKTNEITDDPRLALLNENAGDILSPGEIKKNVIADMLLDGAGYIYVDRVGNNIRSLRYVRDTAVSYLTNADSDPIFKRAKILVNAKQYDIWQFITVRRGCRAGGKGIGIVQEHSTQLLAAYYTLLLEQAMSKSGGNKKGFLQSEKQLGKPELDSLRAGWQKMNSSSEENMLVLNNGIKFQESSSTAMEMQLAQIKQQNTNHVAMIFGLSPDVLSGKADDKIYNNSIRSAVLPVVIALQEAINMALLLEQEKKTKYFVLDTTELLKADIKSRYEAYRIGLEANFLQPDEIRYKEDLPPLGLDFIKLGLNDVLYDTKTKTFYTPNTNQHATMTGNTLQSEENRAIMQLRQYIQDPKTGQMMGSTGEGGKGKIKSITVNDDGTFTVVN